MMRSRLARWSFLFAALALTAGALHAETAKPTSPDLSRRPTLWVVSYSHLETQWRWDYVKTIDEYLPNTMRDNFALFASGSTPMTSSTSVARTATAR
jgi:alpha-mannosidase